MGEVDKPFGCPQPGCGMSFTNEDHLTVHRRRHEMQLSVSGGEHHTPSLVKHHGFIIDQTPTPTRFLRQCEEVGLFQEISLNPFDEQFRRASLLRSHHSVTESLGGGGGGGESLDTPRVLPPVDSDQTISSTSRDDVGAVPLPSTQAPPHGTVRPHTGTRVVEAGSCGMDDEEEDGDVTPGRLSLNVVSAAEAAQQHTPSVISTPTPVITAGPSVTQSLGLVDVSGGMRVSGPPQCCSPAPQLPTNAALCATGGNSSMPPSSSATVLQLLLRLPNGQAIPVEIPATPVVGHPSGALQTSASPATPSNDSRTPHQSLAKMRLKQALASSSTAARPGGSARASRANTADRIAEMTRTRNFSGTSSTEGEGEDENSLGLCVGMKSGERKRRHSSDNEDPVEKRKKFLERNRAAAIRCREKKKKWIENLSVKYDELGCINQKLQSEVSSLRSEVATLKSMLLQHKDCPVTLAMQDGSIDGMNSGFDMAPCSHTPIQIIAPLPPSTFQQPSPSSGFYQPSPLHHHTNGNNKPPRTRSLSLPSIPSSSATSKIEPLPVNLSSSSSSSSSSYYLPLLQPATNNALVTSVSSSTKTTTLPTSQTSTSYLTHHHHTHPPSSTTTTFFKISPAHHHPSPTSSTQLVLPAASHSPLN